MKSPKEIQYKIDEIQIGVDALEKLIIETKDGKTIEHYKNALEDVKRTISTLEWVLR